MRRSLAIAALWSIALPAAAIEVDGRINADEWAGAKHVTDFKLTQPLSRAPGPHPTEGWILATPEGLAIAVRAMQPASAPRTRQVAQRDAGANADRVSLYVDFDGEGRTGYSFMVLLSDSIVDFTITNENNFSSDWDGNWQHAVSEDGDTWSVEMLIPWHIAPMQAGTDGKRTIGIQLDRVLGSSSERMSWPGAAFQEPRFLSVLEKITIPAYSTSLLAVTPYVVGVFDNIRSQTNYDAGADIFWKPNGRFQLSATLNPDFGQVEADQLVVNFSAVESFFSDRRPFFTENQGFFDVPFGSFNGIDRLIYTRRVGGNADDGSGAGDVTAAVKVNGSLAGLNYGVFAASEADEVGRDFFALRGTREAGTHSFGAMMTRVDRPFLDRVADVYEFDHRWKPTAALGIRTTIVGSDVQQDRDSIRDSGGLIIIDYAMDKGWRQQLYLLHLGDQLQLNDFGFLERNNFNYLRYQVAKRVSELPADSQYQSHDYRYTVATRHNDRGVHLYDAIQFETVGDLRNGGDDFMHIRYFGPGYDDLITRGNGDIKIPAKLYGFYERFTPRKGHWSLYYEVSYAAEGLAGPSKGRLGFYIKPTYFINDNLSVYASLFASHSPDWLLWQHDTLLGTFRANRLSLDAGVNYIISSKQELRVKLETIALDARALRGWRVGADGTPVPSNNPIDDFSLRNLGFQIRYRYELAPLSNLYIAYVRGGFGFQPHGQEVGGLLGDSFSLHDTEQLLIKLSYRFEL